MKQSKEGDLNPVAVPEGRASMTYLVMGPFPGSPLDQWIVMAEPYLEMKGSPGGPGAPAFKKTTTVTSVEKLCYEAAQRLQMSPIKIVP